MINVKSTVSFCLLHIMRHLMHLSILFQQSREDCSADIKLCAGKNCLQPPGESLLDHQINFENMFNIFSEGSVAHCTKQDSDIRG